MSTKHGGKKLQTLKAELEKVTFE